MDKYNNETMTVLLKQLIEKTEKIDAHVISLSNGQRMLGTGYEEIKDVCQERWDRFLELEEKQKLKEEMEKSRIFSILFNNKATITAFIRWMLIIGTALYAVINNNSELIKQILEKELAID
jgi:glutathione peroxidase-family protein